MDEATHGNHADHANMRSPYGMLAVNLLISLAIMYFAMFAMIYSWDEFVQNINFFYMALMMWAPMGMLMLLTMGMMYRNRRLNLSLHAAFAVVFLLATLGIRTQTPVGDVGFLRSMIPHHSGAVLMCEQASIKDPEIVSLCRNIVKSQKEEIAQMKAILARK